jgi:outer membrane protein assembly factor BamC
MVVLLAGCSVLPDIDDVLPDKRTEYRKSESLPDLEVPPDLTAGAINESMAIPNEAQQASYSQYQREQQAPAVAPSQSPAPVDQQWVAVRASRFDIWPRLRQFFEAKGFGLELDDAELGVLETTWSGPMDIGGIRQRFKFKVFSEPGAEPDVTVLFITGLIQEQAAGGGDAWIDRDQNELLSKQIAGELNLHFNATAGIAPPSAAAASGNAMPAPDSSARAEMMNDEEGRFYLSIPEEFTGAWRHTEMALQQGGFIIDERDAAKGFYRITYFDAATAGEEKGWLSKLAFWKDEEAAQGKIYGISLTGVGEKTELIVLNESGDWETNQDAGRILSIIQNQYNTR